MHRKHERNQQLPNGLARRTSITLEDGEIESAMQLDMVQSTPQYSTCR